VTVNGAIEGTLVSGTQSDSAIAVRVDDVAVKSGHVFYGRFGGNNGFNCRKNSPPIPEHWEPDFDQDAKPVPIGGAIVTACGRYAIVYVRPDMFASLVAPSSHDALVAHDASVDGDIESAVECAKRALASSLPTLTDDEKAVVYAYCGLRSCDTRKEIATKLSASVESLIERGLLKRSRNGATAATQLAQAVYTAKRHECERAGNRITYPDLFRNEGKQP